MRPAAILLLLAAPLYAETEVEWATAETTATNAHESGDDATAVTLLQPLITDGITLYGADSPRLIPALRMLSASLANLGRDTDSTRAALQATRIGRASTTDDLLQTLSDLTRDRIDADDTAATALLAAEMTIQDTADDGTLGPYAQEGTALWSLALLRSGHPDEGLARLLPLLRLPAEALTDDTPDLIALFDEESAMPEAAIDDWTTRALTLEAARAAYDQTLLSALAPLNIALHSGDAVTADAAGRAALATVALDDPLVTTSYYALLLATSAHPDLAATWALRLAAMPPNYLASLDNDPLPVLETSADWLLNQGRTNEAIQLSESIAALAPLRDPTTVPRTLARLGAAYRDAGHAPQAKATLLQALNAPGLHPPIALQIQTDLALLAQDQGHPADAEAAYKTALTLLPTLQDPNAWTFLLSEYRAFLITQNRLPEALAMAQQAAQHAQTPATLRDLAESQLDTGDATAALETLQRTPPTPRLLALQSAVLAKLGRSAEAATTLHLALSTPTDLSGLIAVIEAAKSAQAMGDPTTALHLMTAALNALPPDHPMQAYLHAGRASIDPDPQTALTDLRAATLALTQPDRRAEPQARDHLALHVTIALHLAAQTTGTAALNLETEAFQVAQRVNDIAAGASLSKATARLQGDGPKAATLARQLDDADSALAMASQSLITQLASGQDATPQAQALTQARTQRATLLQTLAQTFPLYAAYADPKPLDLLSTAALLKPNEALILYATADPATSGPNATGTVFAITHDAFLTAELPPRADLATLAHDLRCAAALTDQTCGNGAANTRGAFSLDAPAQPFDLTLARQAYLTLIDPISAILQGKTALIIVPDRTLIALPFHLLLTADTPPDTPLNQAPWLIRQAAITILPSVANLKSLRSTPQHDSAATLPFLGIGDPLLGAKQPDTCATPPILLAMALTPALRSGDLTTLPPLPDTACELTRAAALFGTPDAVLLQENATETRVKTLSASGDLARYRVLSFATHGLIAGELGAADAALILTPSASDDGLLTATEIAALRLDADFVILSACNTAAGNADTSEGLSGLASAFFLAGARSLLVSHWPVYSDAATKLTSALLQAQHQDPTIGRAEALRLSMLSILNDPNATQHELHPAYWAPFLITGDGG